MEFHEDAILQPVIVLAIQTLIIMLWMFGARVSAFRQHNITPDQSKHTSDAARLLPSQVRAIGDNFSNLAELPVVFYAVTLTIWAAGHADQIHIYCAWGFVIFRIVHSLVQIIYNNVLHRFGAYLVGALFLIVMVIREAQTLFID